jgi:hypothetical protein
MDREQRRLENLTRLWRWLRLQFLLMGEGATASIDDNHHSVADSRPPKAVGHEVRFLDERWANCQTNGDRRAVIKDAQRLLRDFKFPRADPRTIRDTQEWRIAIAADERPAPVVARYYGVSKRTVYNYRNEYRPEDKAAA